MPLRHDWTATSPLRRIGVFRPERPRVIADVLLVPGIGIEVRIAAIFEWVFAPKPRVMLLRRELLPHFDQQKAQETAEEWWAEHVAWGEPSILQYMWERPGMTPEQVAEYRAKDQGRRKELEEQNARLLHERREASSRYRRN